MIDDFTTEHLIFLSRIVFIQNTIFRFFETDTSKEIFTIIRAHLGIIGILEPIECLIAKSQSVDSIPYFVALKTQFSSFIRTKYIHIVE